MNYIKHLNNFFIRTTSHQHLSPAHISLYLALFQLWNQCRFQSGFPVHRQKLMRLSRIGSKATYHRCLRELHNAGYISYAPAAARFQPVHIYMCRFDNIAHTSGNGQPMLFSPGNDTGRQETSENTCPGNDTGNVPGSVPGSPGNGTGTVPLSGHLYKQNNKQGDKQQQTLPPFLEESKKIIKNIRPGATEQVEIKQSGVRSWFAAAGHPQAEADKFYNHYKALGWRLQGVTPVTDWQSLAAKWMLNARQWSSAPAPHSATGSDLSIEDLRARHQAGKKIFHLITSKHIENLSLQPSAGTMQQALRIRIEQVSGTNQYSLNQLWNAYLSGDDQHPLIQQDHPRLLALARRLELYRQITSS